MKRSLQTHLLLLITGSLACAQTVPQVKKLKGGTSNTCITLDAKNNLWVGTAKEGLYIANVDTLRDFASGFRKVATSEGFDKFNIQTIAASTEGASSAVWVGHNGHGSGSAALGGITLFKGEGSEKKYMSELDKKVATAMRTKPAKNDGIPSRNCKAIAVSKYGSVWAAHGYHDLLTSGMTYSVSPWLPPIVIPGGYFLTPGGVGYNPDGGALFHNVANNPDDLDLSPMPYPAYTINPPVEKSAGTRQCYSVACGPDEVWVGNSSYETGGGAFFTGGINRFDLFGKFLGRYDGTTAKELPFNTTFGSPFPIALHFEKNGRGWVAFNRNLGFATYKNGTWTYVGALKGFNKETQTEEASKLLPNGIKIPVNQPHLIVSSGKKVFIGTQDGILVYKGKGDYAQDSSYVLVTTEHGLSSNNIRAMVAGPKYVYVVTDAGVDQVYIPGDVEVMHIRSKENPNRGYSNYVSIKTMENNIGSRTRDASEDLPMLAADGTKSTVFRYYTSDFEGFYAGKYEYAVNSDYDFSDTARYGKLRLRNEEYYEVLSSGYVDFIYTHPRYIDPNAMFENEATYLLTIRKKDGMFPEFQHQIKIVLPPVLLVHGVWSNIESLLTIEGTLLQNHYKTYQITKAWRRVIDVPENPYEYDKREVSDHIKRAIRTAENNGMSAGKVNVVVHSRGGLYTRAYIEGLNGVQYEDDVHSLITLNTPHSGSQLANVLLDTRMVVKFSLGSLFSFVAMPESERGTKEGAKVLRVDKGFITELNSPENLKKLEDKKVPIHAVATNASLCDLPITFCDHAVMTAITYVSKYYKALRILSYVASDLPKGVDGLLRAIHDGEVSDLIVPKSSMEAGLDGRYKSLFEGENISHISGGEIVGMPGVTTAPIVLNKIVNLLKEDVTSEQSSFSKNGLNPPTLKYTFLGGHDEPLQESNLRLEENGAHFEIKYHGDTVKEGDTLHYVVKSQGYQSLFVSYEHEFLSPDSVYMQDKDISDSLTHMSFKVPKGFYGNLLAIVFGVRNGKLTAVDTLKVPVGLKKALALISFKFKSGSEVDLVQNSKFGFVLLGRFSDSLERVVNTFPGMKYYVEDTLLLKRLDHSTLYAKTNKTGRSSFVAFYANMSSFLEVNVLKNNFLEKTLLSSFTALKTSNGISLRWETDQEYRNKKFLLEKSNAHGGFDSLYAVKGAGTSYDSHQYSYLHAFNNDMANTYYRLKIIDSSNNYVYSDTLHLPTVLATPEVEEGKASFSKEVLIVPNPATQEGFQAKFESLIDDPNAEISFYSFAGHQVFVQKMAVKKGMNVSSEFTLYNTPPGIYFLKIKTASGVQSSKVILTY